MAKEDLVQFEGVVQEVLRDARFLVKLDNGMDVAAYASGKMRKFRIRILAGDRVTLEMSPYDLSKARISFRHKETQARRSADAI
ncbi:MAG: translation initiation factor IF-1 [Rhodocyclaceae bacterium]|nr:translation initiation factor IF-1 [Rhodocyclaceae bacterium]